MNSRSELEILIRTIADTRGIETTDAAVKKVATDLRSLTDASKAVNTSADDIVQRLQSVGKGANETGKETQNAAKGLTEMQKAGAGASAILNGLERASQGGFGAIVGLTQATRGFITLVRGAIGGGGVLALLGVGLGAAAAAAGILYEKLKPANDQLGDTKQKAEEAGKALDEIKDEAVKAVALQIERIAKGAADAVGKLRGLKEAADALAADKLNRDVAALGADPSLTPAQREAREFELREAAERERQNRARLAREGEVAAVQGQVGAANTTVAREASSLREARQLAQAVREELAGAREGLDRAQIRSAAGIALPRALGTPEQQRALDDAERRVERLESELKRAEAGVTGRNEATNKASEEAVRLELQGRKRIADINREQQTDDDRFELQRQTRALDFSVKQRERLKELAREAASVDAELAALQGAEERDPKLGGDAARQARITELRKRRGEISTETSTRAAALPALTQQNTDALREVTSELKKLVSALGSTVKPAATGTPAAAPSAGPGVMTTSDGRQVTVDRSTPSGPGTITRDGQTLEIKSEKTVAELAKTGQVLGKTLEAVEWLSGNVTKKAEKVQAQIKVQKQNTTGGG